MDIRPVQNGFGSEIWGVNLTKTDDVLQREPKKVLLRHQVLIIREQNLSPSQQLEFSKGSGPLDIHVRVKDQHPDYEDVSALTTEMKDGKYIGAPHAAVPTERCSDRSSPPAVHPVVRTRPETGQKALYVTERFTLGI